MRGYSAVRAFAAAATPAPVERSAITGGRGGGPPRARSRAAVDAARVVSRATTTTERPARVRASAVARPIPEVAPVTTAMGGLEAVAVIRAGPAELAR
jgi:hypothetical protein